MRIAFLARGLGVGGAERQMVQLAVGLAQRGHAVAILTFYAENQYNQVLAAAGVVCQQVGKRHRWDVLAFLWALRRALLAQRPDVVYSFLPMPNVLVALLKPFLPQFALVWGVRASDMHPGNYDRLSRLAYGLERRLARVPHLTITNSDAGRDYALARAFPAATLAVVRNGIDTARFRPANPAARAAARMACGLALDAPVIGVVARADPMKDHETFFKALALMVGTWPDLRAVLVGPAGPGAARLQQQAAGAGVAGHLVWAGAVSDTSVLYAAFDVVCLPSAYGEGFPNVLGEALSCGLPCVATTCGDAALVLGDQGITVPPRAPAAMAAALAAALGCPHDPDAAVRRRQRVIAHFSVASAVAATEDLLHGLVNAGKSSSIEHGLK